MVKIGILNNEHTGYSENQWTLQTFENDTLRNDISSYFTNYEISSLSELFDLINNYLLKDQPKGTFIDIKDIYFNQNYVIQTIAISCNDDKIHNYNRLGTQLVGGQHICGNMILIKREVSLKTNNYLDFTLEDFIFTVKKTFVHTAIIVNCDDTIQNFTYIKHPLEWLNYTETIQTLRSHEFKLLDYILTFYVDITIDRTILNKNASIVFGKKIYGRVIITLYEQSELNNLDLDDDIFNKIVHICKCNKSIDINEYKKSFSLNQISLNSTLTDFPNITHSPNFYFVIYEEFNKLHNFIIPSLNYNNLSDCINDII